MELDNKSNFISGRNAVIEALSSGRKIESILVSADVHGSAIKKIISLSREKNIPIKEVSSKKLDGLSDKTVHQGVIAVASSYEYVDIDEIFQNAAKKNQDPFIVIADGIEDPHNLGAIVRTVECVGAHGLIIPSRRAVGITPTVEKTSAGAIEHVLVSRVTNIANTVNMLKQRGIWVYAAEAEGISIFDFDLTGPIAIVIGSEGRGVSRLVKEKCDSIVSLPLNGKISSLNASVATGVLLYETLRQRIRKG